MNGVLTTYVPTDLDYGVNGDLESVTDVLNGDSVATTFTLEGLLVIQLGKERACVIWFLVNSLFFCKTAFAEFKIGGVSTKTNPKVALKTLAQFWQGEARSRDFFATESIRQTKLKGISRRAWTYGSISGNNYFSEVFIVPSLRTPAVAILSIDSPSSSRVAVEMGEHSLFGLGEAYARARRKIENKVFKDAGDVLFCKDEIGQVLILEFFDGHLWNATLVNPDNLK